MKAKQQCQFARRNVRRAVRRGSKGSEGDYLSKLCKLLAKMGPNEQKLLLHMAQKVAKRR
jgi:cation transport regulator ChaC